MIWVLLFFATAVFGFVETFLGPYYTRPQSAGEIFFVSLVYILLLFIAFVIWGGLGYGAGQLFPSHPVVTGVTKLAVVRDEYGVSGRFFLGSGFVDSKPYYFYYAELPGGRLRPGRIAADDSVTVYQEDRSDAEMTTISKRIVYPWWAWLVSLPDEDGTGKEYVFRVPKGTVAPRYRM